MSWPGSPNVTRTADNGLVRVTHIAPTPFGQSGLFGGGERYPLELARALAKHVDCELITFGREAGTRCEPCGLQVRTLRAVAWLGGHPAHPLSLGLPAALRKTDVVHTHHMRSFPSRIAALTGRIRRVSNVVTDHGLQGDSWGGLLPKLFDLFLTVSRYSAEELNAPPSKTRVIYGGADPARYAPDPDQPRHGVLFVGRLTPHKGVDRLLQALPAEATAIIVGSTGHDRKPPESDYPTLLQHLACDRDVRFAGPVADSDLPALYRSVEVMVLPSVDQTCYGQPVRVSELLGLSVLEAMASGTPVIASRIGGVPEIVRDGETGLLVSPGNLAELHTALKRLLGDPATARRMGMRAREDVIARFTWERVAERCLDAYASIANM